ncbi:MAG: hypothetical protein HYT22_03350, partial [Candidatus Niyogibacteria bacterium]|nr:hypothetical protein [Candidatus Niyogibacteria bacterium]
LALGKGVYVCDSRKEARQALHLLMVDRIHGEAGERVIIEKYLAGFELSIHALSDDKDAAFFPASRDYKRLGDGNTGPNTGGMGAITSAEFGQFLMDGIREDIANPALAALCERGSPFVGCFYPGIMLTKNGPMALEFNARFGDPETQCYMRILKSDLLDLIEACINGTIASQSIEWEPRACVSVVLASEGYPYVLSFFMPEPPTMKRKNSSHRAAAC